jgi:electron transfer flavoprotein-quinone oxidoreductase
MNSEEKFDVIIVGGGPSGLGAAYMLAKYGFNILVIERGGRIGSKNIFGGRIYSYAFKKIIDDFEKDAPIERWVRKERLSLMNDTDALTLELSVGNEYNNSFTTYLSTFLRWLAKRVEDLGAFILTGVKVDKLLIEDGKVTGVLADGDRFKANVVIDAEGINPILIRDARFREDWKPHEVAVGVKEVIKLPKNVIEERLNLGDDEGVAQLFIGYPTKYLPGGGFLYTNKETINIGIVVRLDHAIKNRISIYDLAEDFRQHPYIKNIVKGGSVIEYAAHLVPEVPQYNLDKLYGDGLLVVGDAAGFVLNMGFTIRGVDLAFWSGILAAEAVKKAHDEGKYTKETLSVYKTLLKDSFIIKEMQLHSKIPSILSNASLYDNYVKGIIDVLKNIYAIDDNPKKISKLMIDILHKHDLTLIDLMKDLLTVFMNV